MLEFDPSDPAFIDDPYPFYAALREGDLSGYGGEIYPLSRHADVTRALRSPELFSSRAMVLPGQAGRNTSLIGLDPPVHDEQRNVVNRGFTPRRIAQLEPKVRARVDALFAKFAHRGEVELIAELAAPLPVMVIAELLGLDPSRHDDFKRWSDSMVVGSTQADGAAGIRTNLEAFRDHLFSVIELRRREPGDDLITALVDAEEGEGVLNATQVLHFAQLLLAAGSETTTNLIGNAVLVLLDDPDVCDEVRANPALVPKLLEETLRFESPVQLLMRRTNGAVEIAGGWIPHDAMVMPLLGSANRDPAQFPHADRFDLHRNTTGHVSFGLGTHFCLGASLARLEARVALEAIVQRMRGLALAADRVERHGSFLVRGPRVLPLSFSA